MPSGLVARADSQAEVYASGAKLETSTEACHPSLPAASLKALPMSAHAGRGHVIKTTEWSFDGAAFSGASSGALGDAEYLSIKSFASLTLAALKPDPFDEASAPSDELEQAVSPSVAAKSAAPRQRVARMSSPKCRGSDGELRGPFHCETH